MLSFLILGMVLNTGLTDQAYSDVEYRIPGLNPQAYNISFNPENGDIYLFNSQSGVLVAIPETGTIDTLSVIQIESGNNKRMDTDPRGDRLRFWSNGVGKVYEFHLHNSELQRVDTSRDHMNQFGHAAWLSVDGHIYTLGGYGYWTLKNMLIRFEPESGQWQRINVRNEEDLIKSRDGYLFRDEDRFYYIVEPYESHGHTAVVYELDPLTKTWETNSALSSLLRGMNLRETKRARISFLQEYTHAFDTKTGSFGFFAGPSDRRSLNILDSRNSLLYRADMSKIGIYDVRATFYSERIGEWILVGHPFSTNERDELIIRTFNPDPDHMAVSTIRPTFFKQNYIGIVGGTIAGVILIFIVGTVIVTRRNKEEDIAAPNSADVQISGTKGQLSVTIEGKPFNILNDQMLQTLWQIIYEMKMDGVSEIQVSDLDEQLFSDQAHSSYRSRTRKKLIEIINEACSQPLIREKKSKVDKRIKVLSIHLERLEISSSVS